MNHTYRLVWNEAAQRYVPASELTRCQGKRGGRAVLVRYALLLAAAVLAAGGDRAHAAPAGGTVVAGQGTINQTGDTTTVQQQSQNLSLDWQSFNISRSETVQFLQPSSTAVAVNRVIGSDPSHIYGHLSANGQVFLINPNGVLFGRTAQVNVGSLVASTLKLTDSDILTGHYTFQSANSGSGAAVAPASVINRGTITASDGGSVVLLGGQVSNQGVISARFGTVALAAGSAITLDFYGNHLLNVQVDEGTAGALAENRQLIQADGGTVIMTAAAHDALLNTVVNDTGVIEARTIQNRGGEISLLGGADGGTVSVDGTLDASAPDGGNGGMIETSGAHVHVADSARISTLATSGKTGTWLIDPADYTVAATNGDITGAALGANLQTGNVTILSTQGTVNASGNGDINVNDAVTWTSGTRLTLNAINSVNINAAITNTGSPAGGGVTLRADMNGACVAGAASCGTVTFSGSGHVTAAATDIYYNPAGSHAVADANGNGPSYASPTDYATNVTGTLNASMLVNDVNQLQAINTNRGGTYALGRNIDASVTRGWNTGAGFVPIGSSTNTLTGRFDGQGHTISGLFINLPLQDDVGLFGMASNSTIRHVGLIGADVTGSRYVGALAGATQGGMVDDVFATSVSITGLNSYAGGLVGLNASPLTNAYATGAIKGGDAVGGLVGFNQSSLSGVHATGTVTGNDYVGGLAGYNDIQSTITGAYATGAVTGHDRVGGLVGYNESQGTIAGSYASGDVGGNNYVGGLVGYTFGAESSSYASGSVNGNSAVGGLAGYNFIGATVSTSYATGSVTGTTEVGGLVGFNRGPVDFSYATGSVAGGSAVGGLVGYNFGGQIQSTYATGRVTGSASLGGLIGTNSGSVNASFWDTDTSGQSSSAGGTGQSTANLLTQSTYTGWNFANTWFMADGSTRPFLRSEYSTTINNAHQLQLMQLDLNANYTLANDIDMSEIRRPSGLWNSSRGFVPIGSSATAFTGRFDGQGHTISGLFINLPQSNVGLFATTNNATIRHVGLIGADVTGTQYVGALAGSTAGGIVDDVYATSASITGTLSSVGGLMGLNSSALSNAYATGAIKGSDQVGGLVGSNLGSTSAVHATGTVTGRDYVGGLVGYNSSQSTTGAYATGTVTGRNQVGGLVGVNGGGTIAGSYSSGAVSGNNNVGGLVGDNFLTVSSSYASGSVTGSANVGGLVGNNLTVSQPPATVSSSYATGSVAGGSKVGGLVGLNSGQIQSTYATGRVTGSASLGGLIGKKSSGSVTASFWDTETSGQADAMDGRGTGKTSRELKQLSTFSNWSISGSGGSSAIWRIYEGYTAPLLRSFMTDLTITVDNVSTTYNGAAQSTSIAFNAGSADRSLIFTDNTSYRNAGSYNLGSRVYSNQQGYDISYSGGTMNIARANLTLTTQDVVKTYDGTTSANGVVAVASGTLYDSLAGGTFAFTDKNAGTGKTVTVGGVTVNDGNGGNNYTVSYANNTTSTINAATLTVGGAVAAADKVYDATRDASVSGGVLSGVFGSDSVNLRQSGQFADKNVGTNKAVTATFSLALADAGNYILLEPTNLTASISKANLTVTGLAASDKVYDTTTADTLTGTAKVTALGSDVVALSGTGVGAFGDKNVGNGKAVSVSGYTLTGTDAGNYTLVEPTNLTASITRANLAVTGLAATNKVYDAGTAATLSGTAAVAALGSDVVALSGTGVGAFGDKNVGNGKAVTVSGYTLRGADASNYTLLEPTGLSANITPASLIATGVAANNKVYDTTSAARLSGTAAVTALGTDSVTLNGTGVGAFADKNAGTGKAVSVSGYTISGADASNYILIEPTGLTANITPANLTVTGLAASSKVYDATTTSALSGTAAVTALGSDSAALSGTGVGTFADKNVGNAKAITVSGYTLKGTDASNYILVEPTSLTANITPATLMVAGVAANNKVYDSTAAATLTGIPAVAALGTDTVALSGTGLGIFSDKNVGTGKAITVTSYTLTGADASNYRLVQPTSLTANITPKTLTISGITADDKLYDGTAASALNTTGATLTGAIAGDRLDVSATGAFTNWNAGINRTIALSNVRLTGADSANYVLATTGNEASTTANIAPASLTITANDQTKVAGRANPALTVTYSGFVAGESASSLTTAPTVWTTATNTSPAGNYAIKVSGVDDLNYNITYIAGTLNVTGDPLGVTGNPGYVGAVGAAGAAGSTGQINTGGFVVGPTPSQKESDADESEIYDGMLDIDTPKKVTEALPILSLIVLDKGIRLPNGVQ